jgi:spore coat protein SA
LEFSSSNFFPGSAVDAALQDLRLVALEGEERSPLAQIFHLLDEREVFSEFSGGAISRWAANVLREGTEVIICPSFDSSWNFPVERVYRLPNWSLTGPVHPLLYRLPWLLQRASYLQVFRALLEKLHRGDIVYIHNRPACASALATVADKYGFRVVLHMHNSHLITANQGQLLALKKTPIVFCSEFLRKELHVALPGHFENTHVVYNGADGNKFRRLEQHCNPVPEVIWTGRLVPYKGVHVLLEAMRILERKGVPVRCKIVGGAGFGNSRSTKYVRQLTRVRPSNTEFVGYASGDGLADLLRKADIFCCPSVWNDPFPLAPLEAMATGLPVVASDRGGLPETLAYGGGVLVPANDANALASAIEELVVDEDSRLRMAESAYTSFRAHFAWSNVRTQYENVVGGLKS